MSFERDLLSDSDIPFNVAADWFIAVRQPTISKEAQANLVQYLDADEKLAFAQMSELEKQAFLGGLMKSLAGGATGLGRQAINSGRGRLAIAAMSAAPALNGMGEAATLAHAAGSAGKAIAPITAAAHQGGALVAPGIKAKAQALIQPRSVAQHLGDVAGGAPPAAYHVAGAAQPSPWMGVKTAGFMDPPDEEGVLEGQFEVPVETAVALMSNAITKAVELQTAATVWNATIRGPGSELVRRGLNSWAHESVAKYLATRASVLAGPVHVKDLEPPPPSTDPHSIAHMMIRGEQELIHALGEICAVVGHNPMHHELGRFKSEAQGRIDDLWRALDIEPSQPPLPQPPNKLLKHEQAETPQQEAAESPEFEAAEQAAGVEPPEHHADGARRGAAAYEASKHGSVEDRFQHALMKLADETGAPMQTEAPMAAPTDTRKMSPINYLAAEQLGRQAQEQGEGAYYRNQAQQAQQAMQGLQQQMEQTGMQLQQFQQQAQMSQQQIQEAQMQSQQAQDEALNQTQAAANMRMGIQKLRAQMMEVASQDPTNVALQEAQAQQQQLASGGGQPGAGPAPDMGAEAGPPQQEGPVGGAPGAQPAPGAKPPGGGMPAGGPPPQNAAPSGGADISTAEPQAAAKMSSALSGMLASQASKRLPWALAGAGVGVGDSLLAGASAPGLRKSVAERGAADAGGQGGFYNAMMLAVNKARLAHAEFAEQNPQLSAAVHGGVGALIGGTSGPPIGDSLGRIANHLKDL